ncbi:MAG: hypothetical protein AABX51_03070 [Nanoarchaeota archaeon]
MTKYECSACGYKFVPKTGKEPRICPYCSKAGSVSAVKGMQDLIDETLSEKD